MPARPIKITLTLAEGPSALCGRPVVLTGPSCLMQADGKLASWAQACNVRPKGGYYKCDFLIEWDDPAVGKYAGRFDISYGERCGLARHVYGHLAFHAGRYRPSYMSDRDYHKYQQGIGAATRKDHADYLDALDPALFRA